MENVTYLSSGALNRAHFALVSKQEQGGRSDEAVWETYSAIKARMSRPSGTGIAASIGGFLNVAGLRLQLPTSGWNSKQAREDLLLLLYCRQSLEGDSRKLSVDELLFALPSALTLAEAGQTIEERRIGYLFCAEVLPSDHEMQLLIVNTIRKDVESSNTARIILALDAVIASPNLNVIPAIRQRIEVLSAHRSPHVRRRVLHAYRVLSLLDPEILQDCKDNLLLRLRDDSSMVKSAALALVQACFQSGTFDLSFIQSILAELIRPPKGKKHSPRSDSLSVLTIRAVEALGAMAPVITEGIEGVFDNVLMLGARAAAHRSWGILIACMRTVSRFSEATVTSRLMHAINNSQPSAHPLSFLSPLLKSTDVNVISVLLQSLAVLPVQTWAGGPVMLDAAEGPVQPPDNTKDGLQISPPHLTDIAEAELFGEAVEQDVWRKEVEQEDAWRKAGRSMLSPNSEVIFPALFTEAEVGMIVGLLRSRDDAIRKLTLTILARSDSSSDGIVNQYLGQLLSAVSTAVAPDTENPEDILRRDSLVCQALQVAEVLSGDDGAAYATSTTEILLKADNQRTRGVGIASPTLSSRSRTSTDTKASGKGRGGTMEKAIEMILTRSKRGRVFSSQFSSRVTQILLNLGEDEQLSITFLVIVAATICEKDELGTDMAQRLLERFLRYLPLTSPSVQEAILLVMLRLVGCLDRVPDEVVAAVEDLRHRSGRHIHNRCVQFMNQMTNLSTLAKTIKETKPLDISVLLRAIEIPTPAPPSKSPPTEPSKHSSLYEDSMLGLRTPNASNRELRYQAYEAPTRAKPGASRHRDMRTELLKERMPHGPDVIQGRRGDALDLIELASTINISESTRGKSGRSSGNAYLTESNLTRLEQNIDSPFETTISTVLSEIQPPPFLSRTRSPISSPPLSPGRFQRSPPLSPRINTPTRGSPSFLLGKLNPPVDDQDAEVSFDIRFDRLGTQARTTARGWFDGSMDNVIEKLRVLQYVETSVVYQNGDDAKVQLKQGNQLGLLKLRQEEDHSTLWILRCSDVSLQKNIKEALQ